MNFGQFRIHRDGNKAAVSCAVTGQKILPVGRASKDALAQTVGRMGLVGDFIGLLLLAEKALDFLDAFGIGGGNHLRHFNDPVTLQFARNKNTPATFQPRESYRSIPLYLFVFTSSA